jgi:16S rRNA G1207 methylase RsmC
VTGEHYFSADPAAPVAPRTVQFTVAGRTFRLASAAGVFSADRLDPGTAVLLRKAQLPTPDEPGPLLDLGCGYGPIACVLATAAPAARVYAVDVNTRAIGLARDNATALGLANVIVGTAAEIPRDIRFRQLWSNPPIHIGKPALHELLGEWLPRLTPDGEAWLVAAKHLGGDSLHAWLIDQGYLAQRYASQKGYRILRVNPVR